MVRAKSKFQKYLIEKNTDSRLYTLALEREVYLASGNTSRLPVLE